MTITSSAFKHKSKIPSKYTCDGENINPPLEFFGIPKEARSLVLIVDDPDAPSKTWVHWVGYNIDYTTAKTQDTDLFKRFFHGLLKEGVYMSPSGFEANFLSTAHTSGDLEKTQEAVEETFKNLLG